MLDVYWECLYVVSSILREESSGCRCTTYPCHIHEYMWRGKNLRDDWFECFFALPLKLFSFHFFAPFDTRPETV